MNPIEAALVPLGRALRGRRAGEAASITTALATGDHLTLSSPSFGDGGIIPARHCGLLIGPGISPALGWSDLPVGTADLLLLVEDLDSPGAAPRIHALVAFTPVDGGLPEGALARGTPGIRPWPRRRIAYLGPRPLPGHGTHRYRFHLYALDVTVDLASVATLGDLPAALAGHVLASGSLVGTRSS